MMSELPTQDTATLALMMEREVDKRVVMSLMRMIDPTEDERIHQLNLRMAEQTIDSGNRGKIQQMVAGLIVNVLLRDGTLMHEVRSKLTRMEQKHIVE
jgi:hypothetical protein